MAEQLNMAIVGCGGMAGAHRRGLEKLWGAGLRGILVTAVCDTVGDRTEKMASELAAFQGSEPAKYQRIEDMLKSERSLDAVDIVTDHKSHHTLAAQSFAAGKHVTIEKPLAITIKAGLLMIEAAKKAGKLLHVAENYRRSPEHRAVNWAIRKGRIGTPRMIYWVDISERRWHWGWRDHREIAGGGWSLDGGVHFADLFRYHVGEVKTLFAISKAYDRTRYRDRENLRDPVEATIEDTTLAVLEFQNGVTGQWTSTNSAPGHKAAIRALYGSEGAMVWGEGLVLRDRTTSMEDLIKEHRASLKKDELERLFPSGVDDTIATELHEFHSAVVNGAPMEVDGVQGLKDEAISIAIYESAALGMPVEIARVESGEISTYQDDLNRDLGI